MQAILYQAFKHFYEYSNTIFHFEVFGMLDLHYEIRICQKIYNRVTTHNKSKCLVRNNLHQTLTSIAWINQKNQSTNNKLWPSVATLGSRIKTVLILIQFFFFQVDCPDGELGKDKILDMYSMILPVGNAKVFVDQIFRIFDKDGNGTIDFKVCTY